MSQNISTMPPVSCTLCPRRCGADRAAGQTGFCGAGGTLKAARAALHFWEEPCISGTRGSGTVFFSGCSLGCVFCQNDAISHQDFGRPISLERLRAICFELIDQGAHNINLVNPTHYAHAVARLLAQIYRAVGVLSKGQLVEVDRSGLVAGFVGQTALKTQEVIQKAIGGVLFIDEAYALANQDAPNDFGREAIETLLKGMEDHRDDLIVIAAGYTELMGRFLHANPGLESRFNKYFYFEDYNGAQLLAIFQSMCAKNGYTLDDKATEYAESYFKTLYEERDENFGNARDVRNVFERAVARQSDRVAALEKPGKEELMALTVADLQEEGGPVPDGAPDETLPESP